MIHFSLSLKIFFFRYGVRAPTEECSVAVVVISLQSIVGVVIQVGSRQNMNMTPLLEIKGFLLEMNAEIKENCLSVQ